MAASAGGVPAVSYLLGALPREFPAAILVALHHPGRMPQVLVQVLGRGCALPVVGVTAGQRLCGGMVSVCPGGKHAVVGQDGRMQLQPGRKPTPSADQLMHAVAAVFGDRALAVVLTGYGRDGAAGSRAIRRAGGFVLAQQGAEFSDMPMSAIEARGVDLVLPLSRLAFALQVLAGGGARCA